MDHSLFVEQLAIADGFEKETALRLALRLHDAHEAMTSDVPSDLKPDIMRAQQKRMDLRLMNTYFPGGYDAYEALVPLVKDYDMRALVTEAYLVGPPKCRTFTPAQWQRWFKHEPPTNRDITILHDLVTKERLSRPGILWQGPDAANVKDFVRACEEDMALLRLTSETGFDAASA